MSCYIKMLIFGQLWFFKQQSFPELITQGKGQDLGDMGDRLKKTI